MGIAKKIWKSKWMLRNIFQSIYFNFHYLPFKQAVKLPIILYKPTFLKLKGKLVICGGVKTGMIIMGKFTSVHHSNNGIKLFIDGNITFGGKCNIGNDSYLAIKKTGNLKLGDNFQATAGLKIECAWNTTFGSNVLVGFDCWFMDNDMHQLSVLPGRRLPKPYGSIVIGEGCWLAFRNVILKNTFLPAKCVVASNSLLNKEYKCDNCSLLAGNPAIVIKEGVYLDRNNHVINFKEEYYD